MQFKFQALGQSGSNVSSHVSNLVRIYSAFNNSTSVSPNPTTKLFVVVLSVHIIIFKATNGRLKLNTFYLIYNILSLFLAFS